MNTEVVPLDESGEPTHNGSLLTQAMAGSNAGSGALARAMASRETASVLTAALVAKQFPRDEVLALTKIKRACNRPGLAAASAYSYSRGGQDVTGPTIRIAEAIAQAWGNVQFGWDEIDRTVDPKKGILVSKVKAYARDVESNTYVERMFDVPHWRDKRGGGEKLESERDIYELCANQASRRVRACILSIIPQDIVDDAMFWCEETLKSKEQGRPLADRIRDMMVAFGEVGVSQDMLAAKIGHTTDSMTEAEFRQLGKKYVGIRDGYTTVEKEFVGLAKVPEAAKAPERQQEPEKKARKTKPAAQAPAETPEEPDDLNMDPRQTAPPANEAMQKLPIINALVARATLEGFDPNAFVDWAQQGKLDGVLPGQPIGAQPIETLQDITNWLEDAVNVILSAKKA